MSGIRITYHVLVLLQVFLDDVNEQRYGYDLLRLTGWASGKLYPMLAKLEAAGWLESELEQVDASVAGRPRRRWYRLSHRGSAMARQEVAEARARLAPGRGLGPVDPRPQGSAA